MMQVRDDSRTNGASRGHRPSLLIPLRRFYCCCDRVFIEFVRHSHGAYDWWRPQKQCTVMRCRRIYYYFHWFICLLRYPEFVDPGLGERAGFELMSWNCPYIRCDFMEYPGAISVQCRNSCGDFRFGVGTNLCIDVVCVCERWLLMLAEHHRHSTHTQHTSRRGHKNCKHNILLVDADFFFPFPFAKLSNGRASQAHSACLYEMSVTSRNAQHRSFIELTIRVCICAVCIHVQMIGFIACRRCRRRPAPIKFPFVSCFFITQIFQLLFSNSAHVLNIVLLLLLWLLANGSWGSASMRPAVRVCCVASSQRFSLMSNLSIRCGAVNWGIGRCDASQLHTRHDSTAHKRKSKDHSFATTHTKTKTESKKRYNLFFYGKWH